ncbi:ester cyclase [Actinomycetospora sp.]|uniref:ester cyclase n=1 Tax=Actinomycetospora sp. TaxID=1872135 RepID=UPI002F416756
MTTHSSNTPDDLAARLMSLWSTPLPDDDAEALAAVRGLYTDSVEVNGTVVAAADLLARARALQGAYSGLHHHLLDRVDTPDRLVIAFRLRGTHTGPLATPLGTVAPTGQPIDVRVIDVLTLTDGRISGIHMVADELGLLTGLGALELVEKAPTP